MFPFTKIYRVFRRISDLSRDTHCKNISGNKIINRSFINTNDLDTSNLDITLIKYLSHQYHNHCFDLLGSGWVKNSYSSEAFGMEGFKYQANVSIEEFDTSGQWLSKIIHSKHLKESRFIWKHIKYPYEPIDWQKDIKSGYRWSAKIWYQNQRKKYFPGADLKMPWEISRFYHLVQLAVFSLADKSKLEDNIREFHNQVIDFFATNPPRMGINWVTSMEVAIRSVNLLLSYDIFNQLDNNKILDDKFKVLFSRAIFEHGQHIYNNLEYHKNLTSNHYLANIIGLLFIGAYLPESEKTRKWLIFALKELHNEIFKQFLPDGVNFESSTAYHTLSSTFFLYSIALITGIYDEMISSGEFLFLQPVFNNIYFPDLVKRDFQKKLIITQLKYDELLYKTGYFLKIITKPNQEIPQIGDNDSGRLIKLTPVGKFLTKKEVKEKYIHLANHNLIEDLFWDENTLVHTPLLASYNGIFQNNIFDEYGEKYPLEKSFVTSLAKYWKYFSTTQQNKVNFTKIDSPVENSLQFYKKYEIILPKTNIKTSLSESLTLHIFPSANFFIFRSPRLYLAINGMNNGQNGNGGHSHNDKLSFELSIDGKDIIVDPGTYVYTSLPEKRNFFRSTNIHNTIIVPGEEQNKWDNGIHGLFRMNNDTQCKIVFIKKNGLGLQLSYRHIQQIRIFKIEKNRICIADYCNLPFHSFFNYFKYYSNGYGKLINFMNEGES